MRLKKGMKRLDREVMRGGDCKGKMGRGIGDGK